MTHSLLTNVDLKLASPKSVNTWRPQCSQAKGRPKHVKESRPEFLLVIVAPFMSVNISWLPELGNQTWTLRDLARKATVPKKVCWQTVANERCGPRVCHRVIAPISKLAKKCWPNVCFHLSQIAWGKEERSFEQPCGRQVCAAHTFEQPCGQQVDCRPHV